MKRLSTIISGLLLLVVSTNSWPYYPNFEQFHLFRGSRDVLDNSVDSVDSVISHLAHFAGRLYGVPDNRTGLKVAQWHEGMGINPEELGEYAEGDILFPDSIMSRNGVKAGTARWPGGVIPYIVSPFFSEFSTYLILVTGNIFRIRFEKISLQFFYFFFY